MGYPDQKKHWAQTKTRWGLQTTAPGLAVGVRLHERVLVAWCVLAIQKGRLPVRLVRLARHFLRWRRFQRGGVASEDHEKQPNQRVHGLVQNHGKYSGRENSVSVDVAIVE